MGLLDRIGAFDRYKVSPTQGTSGLLTGAGRPMSPFAQQAARQIGGALGMDMRTPQERLAATVQQKGLDSPEAMQAVLANLAKTDPTRAVQLANQMAEKRKTTESQARQEEGTAAVQDVLLTVDKDSFYGTNTLDTVATLQQEYNISPSQLDSIYDSVTTARGITKPSSTAGEARFFSRGKVRDSQTKEEYFVTEAVYKDGTTELIYKNSKGETVTPTGAAITISGTTGQSGADKDAANLARDEYQENLKRETLRIQQKFNIGEKEAELWLQEVAEARTKVIKLAPQIRKAAEQRELLTRIKTGGIVPASYKAILSFLGIEAQGVIDAERFNKLAKDQMIGVLGSFGSNPTEGERASAQELVASINDLTQVNVETIDAYIRELQYSYDDYVRVLTEGATPQSVADARLREVEAAIDTANSGLPNPTSVQDDQYYSD